MEDYEEIDYSDCCGEPFGHPGYPDCDICLGCGEHSEPAEADGDYEGEPIKCKNHLKVNAKHYFQGKGFFCDECIVGQTGYRNGG
ncbi:MAG: hypothetical protein H8E55_41150 [Pelagibacterales bacterium]|nr:hypothetical protein [Pelagibacterales bacterium]